MIAGACRVVVGAVFLVSGTLKLRQPAWRQTAGEFGAPAWLAPALPVVEIVVGALLVAQVGGPWVPLAALALLLAFTAAIVRVLARGQAVPCACFGELSVRPVDRLTVARNLALCTLALVAVVVR